MSKGSNRASTRGKARTRTVLFAGVSIVVVVAVAIIAALGEEPDQSELAIDTAGTPTLDIDTDYVDFGDVPFNQMVESKFEVTNTGDAALLFAEEPFVELKDGC